MLKQKMRLVGLAYIGFALCLCSGNEFLITKSRDDLDINMNLTRPVVTKTEIQSSKCSHEMYPQTVVEESELKSCCEEIHSSFRRRWTEVLVHLSDYLRTLRSMKCPYFAEECRMRTYAFTEFNRLTYDRFCNEAKYLKQCENDILRVISHRNKPHITNTTVALQNIGLLNLTLNEIKMPCIQAALIDVDNLPETGYFEIKETQVPMCGIAWCGFPADAFDRYQISERSCISSRCNANIIVLMCVAGLLGVTSTIANLIALYVFANNKKLRDSQGIYKISLAVADLFVGVFVFPTVIESMRRAYHPVMTVQYNVSDGHAPMLKIDSFTNAYYNFIGFFTTLSTSVSVYTLMIASFDRFMVVFRPLRYNLYTAKSLAAKLSITVWILGVVFGILPIVLPNLEYLFIAALIVSMTGEGEFIILSIAFLLPIFFVCVVNILTFIFSKQNAKVRPKVITNGSKVRSINVENRLAKTLSIMVGAYLVCLLPLAIVITLHLFLEGINTYDPENLNTDTMTLVSALEIICCIVFMSNSLWNFFIYNIRSTEFRNACKKLFYNTKDRLRSKLFRDSAKIARDRRISAAISSQTSSQLPNTISSGQM